MRVERRGQMSSLPNRGVITQIEKIFFLILKKKIHKNLTPNYITRLCLAKEQISLSKNFCALLEAFPGAYSSNFIHFPHCISNKQSRVLQSALLYIKVLNEDSSVLKYYSMISYYIVLYMIYIILKIIALVKTKLKLCSES